MSPAESEMRRTILMGDPSYFSVKGGGNPHTRTRWGTKRSVDRERAIQQWHGLKQQLEELGIAVIVVPPVPENPGTVYPANAGFQSFVDAELPLDRKTFTLSNLLPTRAGEKKHYRALLEAHGFRVREIDESLRFEGEADYFPAGDLMLLTHGSLERQRFVPTWGIPPWKRVYGFRTDARVEQLFAAEPDAPKILRLELVLEAHYHGDTALCAFGPGRRFLLGYRDALTPEGWRSLETHFGDRLIELGEEDAKRYAANSFTYTPGESAAHGGESFLVMPSGVSERLRGQVQELGVTPVVVEVSEFLKKGGGSVKCMIGDLGPVGDGDCP